VKKDVEFEQAVDSLMNGIDQISSEWSEMKNGENNEADAENLENDVVEMEENVDGEGDIENEEVIENIDEVVEDKRENQEIQEKIVSDE